MQRSHPRQMRVPDESLRWVAALLIGAAVAAVYGGSLHDPFIYDDGAWILANPGVHHLWPPSGILSAPAGSPVRGRPLLSLSLAANYAAGGENPWGYHVVNTLVHAAAALALFGLARRTLAFVAGAFEAERDRTAFAFAVAVLWAVHPLQTEAVTYVSQRAESLMGLLYLLTLYGFVRSLEPRGGRGWAALSVAACGLGMATKEVMASAPLVVLLYDRTFVSGTFSGALRARWATYLGLACTWLVLAFGMAGLGGRGAGFGLGYSWWAYGFVECWVVARYLLLAFWPHPLVFDYGTDVVGTLGQCIPPLCLLSILGGATLVALSRRSPLGFAGAWFFAILAPTSSLIPVASAPMAESRMYLPLAGVIAAALGLLWAWRPRSALRIAAAAAVLLAVAARLRNGAYASPVAIWSDTVLRRPLNPRARLALGEALSLEGRHAEAAGQFREAIRISPGDFGARRELGLELYRMGQVPEALAVYRAIAPPTPDSAPLHYDIALALAQSGRAGEALGELESAERLDPADADVRCAAARLLEAAGRRREAAAEYREALRLRPGDEAARAGLARAGQGAN